ncbi:MAG: alpha/beta fold hydrolase [Caulobacter sp.]|nr:alpha/beta fold hydrolase [Caulobacter sp.]
MTRRAGTQAPDPLTPWLEAPGEVASEIRSGSRAYDDTFSKRIVGYGYLKPDRLGLALLARDGAVVFANARFEASVGPALLDKAAMDAALAGDRVVISRSEPASATGAPVTMAYGPSALARGWALPEDCRQQLARTPCAVVVLAIAGAETLESLSDACDSFGLTAGETRVVIGLIGTGNLRDAAQKAGVGYATARKAVFEAMRRMGVTRQTAMVERLLKLSLGVWPVGREGDAVLSDTWGLTARQGALAYRISVGMTRTEAARATGVSDAVAKKELAAVFATLGVNSMAALSRFVVEARALAMLTDVIAGGLRQGDEVIEPLRVLPRPDGSFVGFSDYGPRSGKPVLVLHSSSSTRPAPRRLVRALHAARFRPIAIDRPGFGMTDPGPAADHPDPFEAACPDIERVLDALKISRIDVIARGGAQVALAMAASVPERIGRVILLNPDPPTRPDEQRRGPIRAVKELFFRRPELIERFANTMAAHISEDRARQVIARLIEGSEVDTAAMADPLNYADFYRGIRMFLMGRAVGYVREQIAMTRSDPPPLKDASDWRVFIGAADPLHDHRQVDAYWRGLLPGARFETLADGGRFIAMTHADRIVSSLSAEATSS